MVKSSLGACAEVLILIGVLGNPCFAGNLVPFWAGDGNVRLWYSPHTGELRFEVGPTELTSVNIDSSASIFTGEPARNLGGSFDNDADNNIFKAVFGGSFGSLSFGNVAQLGLSEEFVRNDLTVVGSLLGGGDLGKVECCRLPEPSTLVLALLAAVGFDAFVRLRSIRWWMPPAGD